MAYERVTVGSIEVTEFSVILVATDMATVSEVASVSIVSDHEVVATNVMAAPAAQSGGIVSTHMLSAYGITGPPRTLPTGIIESCVIIHLQNLTTSDITVPGFVGAGRLVQLHPSAPNDLTAAPTISEAGVIQYHWTLDVPDLTSATTISLGGIETYHPLVTTDLLGVTLIESIRALSLHTLLTGDGLDIATFIQPGEAATIHAVRCNDLTVTATASEAAVDVPYGITAIHALEEGADHVIWDQPAIITGKFGDLEGVVYVEETPAVVDSWESATILFTPSRSGLTGSEPSLRTVHVYRPV